MSDLVEFLLARISDDEAWTITADCVCESDCSRRPDCPDRVLAECAAKRRIIDLHPQTEHGCVGEREIWIGIRNVPEPEHYSVWACPTLLALALPYAGHPDYPGEDTQP